MVKNIKLVIGYIATVILVIIGIVEFNAYRDRLLLNTIKDILRQHFENTNTHIASHDFSISNIKIICKGNAAYIVEFNLNLNNNSTKFNKLGATLYKSNNTWHVKGFGSGLTADELELYNFKCYK